MPFWDGAGLRPIRYTFQVPLNTCPADGAGLRPIRYRKLRTEEIKKIKNRNKRRKQ